MKQLLASLAFVISLMWGLPYLAYEILPDDWVFRWWGLSTVMTMLFACLASCYFGVSAIVNIADKDFK